MRKLRIIPIAITLSLMLIVWFGGWFLYQYVVKESPLQARIASLPQVVANEISWEPNRLKLSLELESNADLRLTVQEAFAEVKKQVDDKEIRIEIVNKQTTDKLERWWSRQLFQIAEAMSHQKYSDIPKTLEQQAAKEGLQVTTEMDQNYVYVTVREKEHCLWRLLPLNGDRMGVWPNEQISEIMA